ncbi:MAG: TetR/AcrR family transcriptional regulator [Desulfobacteraceae bacterium]|nr:MAG: TetR/AcrR family transcriptional regulator [Desulfobacteraceae bacterium]
MNQNSTFALLRNDEREVRRQVIIDSTIKMLSQRPFVEIGMREIAAAAGVSPASIYRYFPGRNDLLVEAFVHQMNMIGHEFNLKMADKPMSLEEFSEYVVDHLANNEATFQMMTYLMVVGQMPPRVLDKYNEILRRFIAEFRRVLEINDIQGDLRIFAQTFFSALAGITMAYRNYPGRSKEEIRKHMKRHARIIALMFERGSPE